MVFFSCLQWKMLLLNNDCDYYYYSNWWVDVENILQCGGNFSVNPSFDVFQRILFINTPPQFLLDIPSESNGLIKFWTWPRLIFVTSRNFLFTKRAMSKLVRRNMTSPWNWRHVFVKIQIMWETVFVYCWLVSLIPPSCSVFEVHKTIFISDITICVSRGF